MSELLDPSDRSRTVRAVDTPCTFDPPGTFDPRSALVLGPEDDVVLLDDRPGRRAGEHEWLVQVVHRRHGTWTHLYRISRSAAPRSTLVHLVAVRPGVVPAAGLETLSQRLGRMLPG